MDRYYTKAIQTLIEINKRNQADHQVVLVNSARALKFLETYAKCQSKLWKILQKYNKVPDDFIDFKSQLRTDFAYLKQAISKNIENLQQALNLQQTYSSALCGHINLIYSKLAKLEDQLEKFQR